MVEPLFKKVFPEPPVAGQVLQLDGDEGKHAASVRRMRVGEAIVLCDGQGTKAHGSVTRVDAKAVEVKVERVEMTALPATKVRLVQALAKGDRDELAIQAATELGALIVTPWQADRSVSRWDAAKANKGRERWQSICDEAAKQSLRAHFPLVEEVVSSAELAKAVEQGLTGKTLVLDPTAATGLESAIDGLSDAEITFIVGPEGGISDAELDKFEAAGAVRVHLGSDILRTSTAGMAAIAVLNTKRGSYR